jgi:hypothetical protein
MGKFVHSNFGSWEYAMSTVEKAARFNELVDKVILVCTWVAFSLVFGFATSLVIDFIHLPFWINYGLHVVVWMLLLRLLVFKLGTEQFDPAAGGSVGDPSKKDRSKQVQGAA